MTCEGMKQNASPLPCRGAAEHFVMEQAACSIAKCLSSPFACWPVCRLPLCMLTWGQHGWMSLGRGERVCSPVLIREPFRGRSILHRAVILGLETQWICGLFGGSHFAAKPLGRVPLSPFPQHPILFNPYTTASCIFQQGITRLDFFKIAVTKILLRRTIDYYYAYRFPLQDRQVFHKRQSQSFANVVQLCPAASFCVSDLDGLYPKLCQCISMDSLG